MSAAPGSDSNLDLVRRTDSELPGTVLWFAWCIRVLAVFDPWSQAVLVVAGSEAGDWARWYRTAIPIVETAYDGWLAAKAEGELTSESHDWEDLRAELHDGDDEAIERERARTKVWVGAFHLARSESAWV